MFQTSRHRLAETQFGVQILAPHPVLSRELSQFCQYPTLRDAHISKSMLVQSCKLETSLETAFFNMFLSSFVDALPDKDHPPKMCSQRCSYHYRNNHPKHHRNDNHNCRASCKDSFRFMMDPIVDSIVDSIDWIDFVAENAGTSRCGLVLHLPTVSLVISAPPIPLGIDRARTGKKVVKEMRGATK